MLMVGSSIVFLLSYVCLIYVTYAAVDFIAETQLIRYGETIVSSGGNFELGFFSPGGYARWYLGIWYKTSNGTVVWVANGDKPLNDSSGVLIVEPGFLALYNCEKQNIWSTKASGSTTGPVVAQLLDSGNFVLRHNDDVNPANYLWQSFDYPGNTFLPGMKFGIDLVTGLNRALTSWKSPADPSTGEYTCRMEPSGLPEFYVRKNTDKIYRSGPWNGLRFSGVPNIKPNPIYSSEFVFTDEDVYYTYHLIDNSVVTRLALTSFGVLQCFMWIDHRQGWNVYYTVQRDNCDRYALCGPFGSCDIDHYPACECLKGFMPKYPQYWEMSDWSGGCVRKKPLDCSEGEGFLKYSGLKLPDTWNSWYNRTTSLEECAALCLKNCSCTAYANMDIRDRGSGCVLWFGDLIDIREYADSGEDIYIRLAASELAAYRRSRERNRVRIIIIPAVLAGILLVVLCLVLCALKRRKKHITREGTMTRIPEGVHVDESKNKDLELPLFDFSTIMEATNGFSSENKLGQGGFGPVYKGILKDGQQIAAKRLSRSSKQGLDEFKNEVLCISKLQHRNLVKLLGGCIEEEEWMLIYEYMPNKSLDYFVFDHKRETILDWPTRFHIIIGIARGLLYLHQDSRLRIIHRDLKASNILLDHEMNPKISDFGMARSFGGDESEGSTNRVVGTYGYMPPEYAIDGLFSVKSDVFSFGVLVLEIVSGKRNRKFSHPDHKLNLLGHAWRLTKEMKSFELIDAAIRDSCDIPEVLRSIHIALLCVQQSPDDRPDMLSVVLMLSSEIPLPPPKEPGFFNERDLSDTDHSTVKHEASSKNAMTITLLKGR